MNDYDFLNGTFSYESDAVSGEDKSDCDTCTFQDRVAAAGRNGVAPQPCARYALRWRSGM